jgi:RNA polymerase sigma-32 factor
MVTSHLRLAAKIAMGYRGYGLPQAEVISEANVGLMQAVKRFDPEKGFRLATYAMWWIRAAIQEYILRSWSLVKLGTTSAQKKLFFNLRKAKARIGALEEGDLRPENVKRIAHDLGVTEDEVISMNRRMSGGDASLNATVGSEDDGSTQWQDWLEDESANQAEDYAEKDEFAQRIAMMEEAMDVLNERERDILTQRRLQDSPVTLEDLSGVNTMSAANASARSRCARSRSCRSACASLPKNRGCCLRLSLQHSSDLVFGRALPGVRPVALWPMPGGGKGSLRPRRAGVSICFGKGNEIERHFGNAVSPRFCLISFETARPF